MALHFCSRKPVSRFFSVFNNVRKISTCSAELLKNRTVLTMERDSCADFLQGLITNDISLLASSKCIYTMILNSKGRVLYDALIYRTDSPDKFHLECGSEIADSVIKHLQVYSLRKKIEIAKSKLSVWAVFQNSEKRDEFIADPRCRDPWVYRCLSDAQPSKILEEGTYSRLRFSLGIAEGPNEIPIGEAFPLEYNADFLKGVSFDKGCYVGQELTARVHHTGVIRKRMMPLELSDMTEDGYDLAEPVIDLQTQKPVGKIRGVHENRALALMRVKETVSSKGLKWGNKTVKAVIPSWWPPLSKDSSQQKSDVTL